MHFRERSKTYLLNPHANRLLFSYYQYLRVEFDDRGDLKYIVNVAKNLRVSFTEQGLYWYASK
jgi:hypothetical protein